MVKSLKSNADSSWMQSIQESTHLIWLAGLGAFAKVSQEGGKVFEALVQEGEKIERRSREAAAGQLEIVREKTDETRGKVADAWDRVEQIFEDRLARVLGQRGTPNRDDVRELLQRVNELQTHVDKLSQRQSRGQP